MTLRSFSDGDVERVVKLVSSAVGHLSQIVEIDDADETGDGSSHTTTAVLKAAVADLECAKVELAKLQHRCDPGKPPPGYMAWIGLAIQLCTRFLGAALDKISGPAFDEMLQAIRTLLKFLSQ